MVQIIQNTANNPGNFAAQANPNMFSATAQAQQPQSSRRIQQGSASMPLRLGSEAHYQQPTHQSSLQPAALSSIYSPTAQTAVAQQQQNNLLALPNPTQNVTGSILRHPQQQQQWPDDASELDDSLTMDNTMGATPSLATNTPSAQSSISPNNQQAYLGSSTTTATTTTTTTTITTTNRRYNVPTSSPNTSISSITEYCWFSFNC
ncbi:unnamed protein product [Rhizophagus irregularis]|nr:unnamed protein product [Rhizophagus irregularis]